MRFYLIAMILTCLLCAGCETFKGFGQDVQKAGDWVERTAERAQK